MMGWSWGRKAKSTQSAGSVTGNLYIIASNRDRGSHEMEWQELQMKSDFYIRMRRRVGV